MDGIGIFLYIMIWVSIIGFVISIIIGLVSEFKATGTVWAILGFMYSLTFHGVSYALVKACRIYIEKEMNKNTEETEQ